MWLYPVSVKENVQTYISLKLCLTLEIKSKDFRTGECVGIGQTTVHNQPVSMHELKYFHDFLKNFAPHVLPLQNIFAPHQYFLPQMKFHSKLAPKVSSKKNWFQKNLLPKEFDSHFSYPLPILLPNFPQKNLLASFPPKKLLSKCLVSISILKNKLVPKFYSQKIFAAQMALWRSNDTWLM